MGYRSDVALVIKSSLIPSIPNPHFEGATEGLLDIAEKEVREGWVCYSWVAVKWYNDYPGVKDLHQFLKTLPGEDFYLAILGEELGDFTSDGEAIHANDCPFWVGPSQTLTID